MNDEELIAYRENLLVQLRSAAEVLTIMVLNAPMKPSKVLKSQAKKVEQIEHQLKLIVVKK